MPKSKHTRYDPTAPFNDYEVHGCKEFTFKDGSKFIERVDDNEAEFWSLYGHSKGQGTDCIGDFASREVAEQMVLRIQPIAMEELVKVLEQARFKNWPHNAAITNDIEALRRICLQYSKWWDKVALPAITAARGE